MYDNVLHIALTSLFVLLMGAAATSHLDPSVSDRREQANRTPPATVLSGQLGKSTSASVSRPRLATVDSTLDAASQSSLELADQVAEHYVCRRRQLQRSASMVCRDASPCVDC